MTDNAIAAQTGQNEDEFASDDDQLPSMLCYYSILCLLILLVI